MTTLSHSYLHVTGVATRGQALLADFSQQKVAPFPAFLNLALCQALQASNCMTGEFIACHYRSFESYNQMLFFKLC